MHHILNMIKNDTSCLYKVFTQCCVQTVTIQKCLYFKNSWSCTFNLIGTVTKEQNFLKISSFFELLKLKKSHLKPDTMAPEYKISIDFKLTKKMYQKLPFHKHLPHGHPTTRILHSIHCWLWSNDVVTQTELLKASTALVNNKCCRFVSNFPTEKQFCLRP